MFTSICLLSCALTLAQGTDRADWQISPRLETGLELVYGGSYLEESLIPNVQHQRQYKLETHVLVLDAGLKDWQVAIMTAMSLREAQDVRKLFEKKDGPISIRLELAKVDSQGRIRPSDKKYLDIPIVSPPTLESGFLVPAPLIKVGRNSSWQVGEPGLPAQVWHVVGAEACGGITCIKVTAQQQSEDWNTPRADRAAWRRRDTVWLHPQLLVAQKLERVIERRDPARDTPTSRTVVRYELEGRLRYPGFLFDERKKEALKAAKFHEEAAPLLRQPLAQRVPIDSLLQRVSYHLDHAVAAQATPYRKASVQLKTLLEKAQKGDVVIAPDEPTPVPSKAVGVGDRVGDFAVSSFTEEKATHLRQFKGKPILVFFYNPATPLGKDVLAYAKRLSDKHTDTLGVMALAVTLDAEVARTQHKQMQLSFPLLDGTGLRLRFGADQTPRFVVLDQDGVVRFAETGWGLHTSDEIEAALNRCLK